MNGQLDIPINHGPWSQAEDAQLTELVTSYPGPKDWTAIANAMQGRTRNHCRERWEESLDPAINHGPWSQEEDAQLTALVTSVGIGNWAAIANAMPGRTNQQCRRRWEESLDPAINHGPWSQEEDAQLTEIVNSYAGQKDWAAIAEAMPGRTRRQCRLRWINH